MSPVEQSAESHDVSEQSGCRRKRSTTVLDANSIRIDAVAGTVTIFPIPGVTVVEVKHKVTREVRFSCPQNVVNKTDPQCAHALAICKIVLSNSGIDETARHELLQRLLPGMGPVLL